MTLFAMYAARLALAGRETASPLSENFAGRNVIDLASARHRLRPTERNKAVMGSPPRPLATSS
jgi:hypothetical protein